VEQFAAQEPLPARVTDSIRPWTKAWVSCGAADGTVPGTRRHFDRGVTQPEPPPHAGDP